MARATAARATVEESPTTRASPTRATGVTAAIKAPPVIHLSKPVLTGHPNRPDDTSTNHGHYWSLITHSLLTRGPALRPDQGLRQASLHRPSPRDAGSRRL